MVEVRGILLYTAILVGSLAGPASGQEPRVLDTQAWRADLNQVVRAVRTTHPRPFRRVDEDRFEIAVERLSDAIPELTDHAIMFRLSGIVGMLNDGHTRLNLPRTPTGFDFSYSHSEDPEPSDPRLGLGQFPIDIVALSDGLFIEHAADGYGQYIGSRLTALGGLSASEALGQASTLVSADNSGARRLLGADLLESPEVLAYVGATARDCGVPIRLERPGGSTEEVCWRSLPKDETLVARGPPPPFRMSRTDNGGHVVLELNEIASPRERPIGDVMAEVVRAAEESGGRLMIDLRHNTGGSNSYGRAVPLAIAQSEELNTYGRVFALIGPRTFSAAQYLLNQLERYTRVLFVGQPSGSHPDHYGDSRKVRLDNSGLTLRVSTLHWSSGTAADQRDATRPHIPVARRSDAVFGPGDPTVQAAVEYRFRGLARLIATQLRRGAPYNAANAGYYDVVSPGSPELSAEDYLSLGSRLSTQGKDREAALAYQIGLLAHPGAPQLETAFEEARSRLQR